MVTRLKITSSQLVSRELALLLPEASYMPRHVEHVPGVMNTWADALSRLDDPSGKFSIPAALRKVSRAHCEDRSAPFYSALAIGDGRWGV